jgi:hypothetical protein
MEHHQKQNPLKNGINPLYSPHPALKALILLLLYLFKSLLDESPLRVNRHYVVKLAVHYPIIIQKLYNLIFTNPFPL